MGGDVHIGILGPLAVAVDGDPIELASPTQRTVLLRLARDIGRPVSTDALADAIWGEDLPKDPVNAVRYHVWKLRDALGADGIIETTPGGYRLDDGIDLDAAEFAHLVAASETVSGADQRVDHLDGALALWRGRPYADVGDDEFAQGEIRRLEELRTAAIEARADALVDAGRTREAIAESEAILVDHPYREGTWSTLMTALYREGRQSDALRAYQRARTALGDDLGLEPGMDLRALEDRILRQDHTLEPAATTSTNLPAPVAGFVGRTEELAAVQQAVADRRLVTIVGVGGAGKTRLAIEVANRLLPDTPGGIWLVDLVPNQPGDDLLDTIEESIGLAAVDRDVRRHAELFAYLRDRPFLLVLDNAEHVIDEVAETIVEVLERCPDGRVLVTSRSPVRVPGETVYAIPVLTLPPDDADWDAIEAATASALFLRRTAEAGATITRTPESAAAVSRLSRELEGIPLAIEMAAARLRTTSLAELADGVTSQLAAYGSQRGTDTRHRTMDAMVDWSYWLLDEETQTLFRHLGVFVGGFTVEAVAHIVDRPAPEVRIAIDHLVEQSLVERVGDGSRYRLLEPIRLFAVERMAEADELDHIRTLHATAFHDIVAATAPNGRASRRFDTRAGFRSEYANLRVALEFLANTGDTNRLCRMVGALTFFFIDDLRFDDQRTWSVVCEPHIGDQPPGVAAMLHLLVAYANANHRTTGPTPHMKAAIDAATASGDELLRADVVVGYLEMTDALAFDELMSPSLDIGLAEEAVEIYRRHGDVWSEPYALAALANAMLWREVDAYAEVIAVAHRARDLAEANGDTRSMLVASAVESAAIMGIEATGGTPPGDVEQLFAPFLDDDVAGLAPDTLAAALANIAWHHYRRGDLDAAVGVSDRWIRVSEGAGVLYHQASAYTAMAVFLEASEPERAHDHLTIAVEKAIERGVDRQTVWMVEVAARFLAADDAGLAARLIGSAEHQRLDERNAMPSWDLPYYTETRRRVVEAAGRSFATETEIGAAWPIAQAAEQALAALRSS